MLQRVIQWKKQYRNFPFHPDFVIVDAMALKTECPTKSVVKADAKSLAVAAASILAKTTRDSLMDTLHQDFPAYNFMKNAGYGTAEHVTALQTYGPCEHHRKSFEPVKSIIAERREKIGKEDCQLVFLNAMSTVLNLLQLISKANRSY